MKLRFLLLMVVSLIGSTTQADIVFLGDKSRVALLKQCGQNCMAGSHKVSTPPLNATASEVATLSMNASHAVIVVDATKGILPVGREHVLVARQAGVPRLSILLSNVSKLQNMANTRDTLELMELMELIELETRQVFNAYEMGGDAAALYHDSAVTKVPDVKSDAIGLTAIFAKLQSTPVRPSNKSNRSNKSAVFNGKTLHTYIYLLTPEEAKHTKRLTQGSTIGLWVNGQVAAANIMSNPMSPGDDGELKLELESKVPASRGMRFLLENKGQIIAAGVVLQVQ